LELGNEGNSGGGKRQCYPRVKTALTPFDPILHDHERRLKLLEASRRDLEDQMVVMAAMERKHAATVEAWEEFLSQQVLDKGERQVAPAAGTEGSAEVDGDVGGDERAVSVAVRAEKRHGGRRYNRPGPSDENSLAAADKTVSAPKMPQAPGTKI
jgi:hypothetical protein